MARTAKYSPVSEIHVASNVVELNFIRKPWELSFRTEKLQFHQIAETNNVSAAEIDQLFKAYRLLTLAILLTAYLPLYITVVSMVQMLFFRFYYRDNLEHYEKLFEAWYSNFPFAIGGILFAVLFSFLCVHKWAVNKYRSTIDHINKILEDRYLQAELSEEAKFIRFKTSSEGRLKEHLDDLDSELHISEI